MRCAKVSRGSRWSPVCLYSSRSTEIPGKFSVKDIRRNGSINFVAFSLQAIVDVGRIFISRRGIFDRLTSFLTPVLEMIKCLALRSDRSIRQALFNFQMLENCEIIFRPVLGPCGGKCVRRVKIT